MPEEGAEVQTEDMPRVPPPNELDSNSWSPLIERRLLREDIAPGRVGAWMRLAEDIGDDPLLNACALAYLSDDLPTDAVVARHPNRPPRGERRFWSASLDHAIWFRHPMRVNEWHLHDFTCRGLVGMRGLSVGNIFDRSGRHIATVSQEVLIRPIRAD